MYPAAAVDVAESHCFPLSSQLNLYKCIYIRKPVIDCNSSSKAVANDVSAKAIMKRFSIDS